jgi:hypothetical protein
MSVTGGASLWSRGTHLKAGRLEDAAKAAYNDGSCIRLHPTGIFAQQHSPNVQDVHPGSAALGTAFR